MQDLIAFANATPEKDLAERITLFVKDYDFYEYQDNMELGNTDEDMIAGTRENLKEPGAVASLIEYFENIDQDDLDESQKAEVKEILQELNGYNTEPLPVYDRETDILYDVLNALKIDDITLGYNSDGLVARDEETEWKFQLKQRSGNSATYDTS